MTDGWLVADVAGDGTTDDTVAVQDAIYAGRDERRPVLLPGQLLLTDTIHVPAMSVVQGSGKNSTYTYLDSEIAAGTRIIAGDEMDILFDVESSARISDLGVDGGYLADYPFRFRGANHNASNIEAIKAGKGSFLFAKTQNGTFTDLLSKFSPAGCVWANGARNNIFNNFRSEVNSQWYDHPTIAYEDATLILSTVDTSNPLFDGAVTGGGNDGNKFFGGINERAPRAIKWTVLNGYAGQMGVLNEFHSVELTAKLPFDNGGNLDIGKVWLEGGQIKMDTPTNPMSAGVVGELFFSGPLHINGGADLPCRGITMRNNLAAGMGFDTSAGGPAIPYSAHGGTGPTITWLPSTRQFEISGSGSAEKGIAFTLDGPGRSGNPVGGANVLRGTTTLMRFTLETVGGNGLVPVYSVLEASPWRRLLGNFAAGSYVAAVDFNHALDYGTIAFTKGDLTTFKVKAAI
jgi:hypothetical protein